MITHPWLTAEWIQAISSADDEGFIQVCCDKVLVDLEFHGVLCFYDGYRLTMVGEILYTFITGKMLGAKCE